MKTNRLNIFALLCWIIIFSGCKNSDEDRIVNKWQLVSIDDNYYSGYPGTSLTINDDGTFVRKDYVHTVQSQSEIKEIGGYWTKTSSNITFLINDMVNVTTMVGGIDSTYSQACTDKWTLVSVNKNELILNHENTSSGCFMDSYEGTTYKFIEIK